MPHKITYLLCIVCMLGICARAVDLEAQFIDGFASRLFENITKDNVKGIFQFDFEIQKSLRQGEAQLRANEPAFRQSKLIEEFRQNTFKGFEERFNSWDRVPPMYVGLAELIAFSPSKELLEVKNGNAYFRLAFKNEDEAPITINGKILKETIVSIKFSLDGQYESFKRLNDEDVYWKNPKPRVFAVHIVGHPGDLTVAASVLGADKSKPSVCQIDGISESCRFEGEQALSTRFYDKIKGRKSNPTVEISFADTKGENVVTKFTIPEISNPYHQYYVPADWIDNRWKCMSLFQVPTSEVFALATRKAAEPRPSSAEPSTDSVLSGEPKANDTIRNKKIDPKLMTVDDANSAGLCPVCKREYKVVYHIEYKGKRYFFRTRECVRAFLDDPKNFGG